MMRSIEFILGMYLITTSDALRFLVVFPVIARSHNVLGQGVCRHLLQAGHEVVYITSFPQEKTVSNLTEVSVGHLIAKVAKKRGKIRVDSVQYLIGKGNIMDAADFFYLPFELHKQVLEDETIFNLLSDPKQQFDAVIVEWFFSDLFAGLAPLFKCPLIYVGTTEPHWQILRLVDEIPNPAYTSVNLFSTSRAPITLWDKICELFTLLNKYFVTVVKIGSLERNAYNVIYPRIAAKRAVTLPSYDAAIYNASMILFNAHPSLGLADKLPQNAKLIGGFHIDDNIKPTPPDMKKLMDEAKHGVIYFSLGTNVQSSLMSDKMKASLLKAFSTLKQIVIWKFEAEIEETPTNVHLIKWAPQQNILAHPNMKMFISHAGQLSSLEAISYGVPMITIPMYGDQFRNAKVMAAKGFSINILLTEHLANDVIHAVREILSNPIYSKKAKEAAVIYHHRLVPPGVELVYWVEHVVKTGGLHLRSSGAHVPAYQKLYIDVLALTFLIGVSIKLMFRFLRKRFCNRKAKIY